MIALYRSGRQADALEAYRHARRELSEQLGLEPGEELR
jgi:DNA-binding SARP family transcriptional activator